MFRGWWMVDVVDQAQQVLRKMRRKHAKVDLLTCAPPWWSARQTMDIDDSCNNEMIMRRLD
jgi:hypothetical protein